MLNRFRQLLGRPVLNSASAALAHPPAGNGIVDFDGLHYDFNAHARWHEGIGHPDWAPVYEFTDQFAEERQGMAWLACERAWLAWLRQSIGLNYRLYESDTALLLTSQGERQAKLKLDYLGATLRRIVRVLEDIAQPDLMGKDILIAFADDNDYYRYVSGFYPEEGEFAMSSGMHLGGGCSHFVTHGSELDNLESTIVHEMTHGCLNHLPIPAWLNEGLAVTIEAKFAPSGGDIYRQQEMLAKHRKYWTPALLQTFWSGAAYKSPDEGNELAYDLGRVLVDGLSDEWPAFKRFVCAADLNDAGAAAAAEHMNVDLGEFVRLFLERDEGDWQPNPACWNTAPERGAF